MAGLHHVKQRGAGDATLYRFGLSATVVDAHLAVVQAGGAANTIH